MCQHVPRGVWLDPRYYGNLPAPWFNAELPLSIGLHALGVFSGGDWNGHPFVDWHHERLWSWGDSPLVYYGKNGILDAYAKVKRRLLALPTSRDAPHKLAASYRLTSLAPETTLHTRDSLLCHISVVDTGGAVWLDCAQWEKGEVRLRWRWFEEGQEGHLIEGSWLLGYAVLPGQSYEFTLEIATPSKPGNYQLELGLVSVQVTTFADQGTAPLRIPVQVTSPSLASSGG